MSLSGPESGSDGERKFFGLLICQGQLDAKAGAFAWLGFQFDAAAGSFQRLFDQGQADASAGIFLRAMHALKHAEYFLVSVFRNADAVVFDPDEGAFGLLVRSTGGQCSVPPQTRTRGLTPGATNFTALPSRLEKIWVSAASFPRTNNWPISTETSAWGGCRFG